ncbi:MAG: hypothetical protein ABI623_12310, partial [bacterium]
MFEYICQLNCRECSIPAFVAGLCACASTGVPVTHWAPRLDANVAADQSACLKEANGVDMNSPDNYSNGRYGAAAAMAS